VSFDKLIVSASIVPHTTAHAMLLKINLGMLSSSIWWTRMPPGGKGAKCGFRKIEVQIEHCGHCEIIFIDLLEGIS
jgi:hypothetical protein